MTESQNQSNHKRVFVALDVPTTQDAKTLAKQVAPHVGGYKIGLELFTSEGPRIVEEIGAPEVFLDLKFHDIPNTVAGCSRAAAKLGVMMFNVHCLGGRSMMQAAVQAAREVNEKVQVIGVTILTSQDAASLRELGIDDFPRDAVRRLARLAREAGLDGVVCSPQEISAVRAECGNDFVLVTPGVRPQGSATGDQKRVMTPNEAIIAGSSWLVVGRPITGAKDPAQAAENLFG
ncbi:MAG TPA: orotidine-5'-phosphate decarboxylase [Abditibacteriaceae bacterium]|jgi:orotidine-5'-phosphate decarboxylase